MLGPTTAFDIYQLIGHASLPAKVVLLLLAALSIYSWAVILRKYALFRRLARRSAAFLEIFRTTTNPHQIYRLSERYRPSPLVEIFRAGYESLREQMTDESRALERHAIERALKRAALSEMGKLEEGISGLASIATSAPFIGLFGTVVGIIIAFQGLSVETQTSIQAVAPGIAEALVATALGLFVAVPAYMAYNYFVSRLRALSTLMEDFALEFLDVAERSAAHDGVYRS
ncbi:Biopolymer transport protein ExbB [bacterium HR10]|nr:Biopolymer transport protein ExbB [bacterium HR10]